MTSDGVHEPEGGQGDHVDERLTRRQKVQRRMTDYRQSIGWRHVTVAVGAAAVAAGGVFWAWKRRGH